MLDPNHRSVDQLNAMVIRMGGTLIHRGPDGSGHWSEPSGTIAFAHRRLAVVDLTSSGCQPMISSDERWVVVFNGEIYNFKSLRKKLSDEGASFKGSSDTEVLLTAVQYWGLDRTLEAIEGMFAIAFWDRFRHELHLVRDRFGEKPLYYGWIDGCLAFASELKAIATLPGFDSDLDRDAISLYVKRNYVPAPFTVYQGVFKLLPGSMITVPANTKPRTTLFPRTYWSAHDEIEIAKRQPLVGSSREIADELEETLTRAVSSRMVADVPIGAFLSGGVDSSLIVALMQKVSNKPVHTFTVGYANRSYDESTEAASIATHLGTDHSTIRVNEVDVAQVLTELPQIWDEPFADSSQIPTLLLSRFSRSNVTVSLSGDAGDELFAGYNRHVSLERLWRRIDAVPPSLRRSVGKSMNHIPHGLINGANSLAQVLPTRMQIRNPSDKVEKLIKILSSTTLEDAYLSLVSNWASSDSLVLGSRGLHSTNSVQRPEQTLSNFTEQMLWLDLVTYLPDDILTKLDRASMAVSLETRVPFLDRDVFRFAWRLPIEMKLRENKSKWILREVLYRHVPPKLIERPKAGFSLPLGGLLRGTLRPWAEELLNEKRLRNQGIVDPALVRRAWKLHLSGQKDLENELWGILMLQCWVDHWFPSLNA